MTAIAIHVDSKFLPPVQEIFAGVLKQFPQVDDVYLWTELLDRTIPTLMLGNIDGPKAAHHVKTLSQKQILSNPAAITELTAALNQLLTPKVWEDPAIKIVDRLSISEENRLGPVLVVDIETGGDINTMTPEQTWLLSVAIYDGGNTAYVYTQEALTKPRTREQLLRLLRSKKLIAHNMKFDFRTLGAHFGEKIYGHCDPMLMHHSINPGAKEHGLKPLAQKYLGAPDWDAAIKDYVRGTYKEYPTDYYYPRELWDIFVEKLGRIPVGYEAIPKDILYVYNAWDVIWDWRLFEYLLPALKNDERLAQLAKMEYRYGNFLQDVENNGLTVDTAYISWLSGKVNSLYDAELAELARLTGKPDFNPNSPPQVKKWMLEQGYPMKSTAEEKLLDAIADDADMPEAVRQFIEHLLEARGFNKLKGTYVEGIRKRMQPGNKVYSTFKVTGTNTGRLSSADPNVQNIPRDPQKKDGKYDEREFSLRRIFVASAEDRILVECDYSQAELRVMACLSNDAYLISLFQPGMPDFFDSLMPIAYPKLDLEGMDPGLRKNLRANLKAVIYGLSYGRKAKAIAKSLGMSEREAQAIITNYFRNAPEFYDWRMWVEGMAMSETETLVTPFGRYYQAEVVTGRNRQNVINSGLAFLPQSTASDLCVNAAIKVHEWIGDYDGKIIALIHDAILTDVPKKHAEEIGKRIQKEMEASGKAIFGDVVPFDTEFTMGPTWEGI